MKIASYNIHFGIGLDGVYDIERIAATVRGADIIALQEVTRNSPSNGGHDMVAELRAALPDYFAVYGSPFAVDFGSQIVDGRAVDRHFEFGNMILSKQPILSSRNLMLPRRRSIDKLNLQRSAIEAMVETPFGPIRFYSIHLDHRSADERLMQVRHLMQQVLGYPLMGGGLTGLSELGFPEPPHPEAFMLLGDFNMLPHGTEYAEICGTLDHEFGLTLIAEKGVDAALLVEDNPAPTCVYFDAPDDESLMKRIDYGFVSAGLAHLVRGHHVDRAARGSDHKPIFFELSA